MTEYSGGRASIHIRCSPQFKAKIAAFAEAKGVCVSDAILGELAEAMKFFDYDKATREDARRSDWETMAVMTQNGEAV